MVWDSGLLSYVMLFAEVQRDYPGFFEQDRRISLFLQAGRGRFEDQKV